MAVDSPPLSMRETPRNPEVNISLNDLTLVPPLLKDKHHLVSLYPHFFSLTLPSALFLLQGDP